MNDYIDQQWKRCQAQIKQTEVATAQEEKDKQQILKYKIEVARKHCLCRLTSKKMADFGVSFSNIFAVNIECRDIWVNILSYFDRWDLIVLRGVSKYCLQQWTRLFLAMWTGDFIIPLVLSDSHFVSFTYTKNKIKAQFMEGKSPVVLRVDSDKELEDLVYLIFDKKFCLKTETMLLMVQELHLETITIKKTNVEFIHYLLNFIASHKNNLHSLFLGNIDYNIDLIFPRQRLHNLRVLELGETYPYAMAKYLPKCSETLNVTRGAIHEY